MKFLFAWELGGGLGHTVPLGQIARPLLQAGHRVDFVLRDLSSAKSALADLGDHPNTTLWQAPVWHAHFLAARHPVAYSELLFAAGYLDANRLLGLVHGWRALFSAIDPDLLLVDHAPTALLAARGLPFPRAICGHGYFVPPHQSPVPHFAEWEATDVERISLTERLALDTCNAILGALKIAPLGALHELYSVDEEFLLTWPELDHYSRAARGAGARYWGGLSAPRGGSSPQWPEGDGSRLFAYLKFEYSKTIAILEQLARGPCVLVPTSQDCPRRLHRNSNHGS